jgi:hypothetical protein
MKLSSLVLLLAAAFAASSTYAQAPRVLSASEAGANMPKPGVVKLPATRPGSYIAGTRPLVTPPPTGLPDLVLPPAMPSNYLPPSGPAAPSSTSGARATATFKTPAPRGDTPAVSADIAAALDEGISTLAPDLPAKGGKRSAVGIPSDLETPAPARRKPSNVFLSRDALQKSRDKCQVQLKSADPVKFATQGGEKEIRLSIVGGRSCVKAISASHDWLTVSNLGANDEVTVSAAENEEPTTREGLVVIANTGASVHIKIRQDANTSGFRRIEL